MSALSRDPCFRKVLTHAVSYALFYHVGGILLDKGKAMPETHQIRHPDARICNHCTRGAVPLMETRSKIEEVTHTLY